MRAAAGFVAMALPSTSDVIVIGAGPAGASVARKLASLGHRVAVLTRQAQKPTLAETIPPSTNKLLENLEWLAPMERAAFVRTTGNTVFWSGSEEPHEARYADGSLGFQVDRAVLNDLLVQHLKRSQCDVIEDATVMAAHDGLVRFVNHQEAGELRARWILDCSGRTGVIARRGWRRNLTAIRTLAIVGMWQRADGWELDADTHTIVQSHADGWAWSVPVSRSERHITVMVDPRFTDIKAHGALSQSYHAELQRVPALLRLTQGAELTAAPFARDASPYAAQQVAAPGVLLVGDAASFVDPLSSFGIKKALASAWLAAVVVHTCLTDSAMEREALAFYEAREHTMHAALERRRAELAQSAVGSSKQSDFWISRVASNAAEEDPNEELDVDGLRLDPRIIAAFEDLKRRESLTLVRGSQLRQVQRPAVRANRVVMEPHLALSGKERTVRYVRNIDLVALAAMAPNVTQVPDLYGAYCRQSPPAPLPDFLGALAFLIAEGFLEFA